MNKKNPRSDTVISGDLSSTVNDNDYLRILKDGKPFGSEMTTSEYNRKIDLLLMVASEMIKLESNK